MKKKTERALSLMRILLALSFKSRPTSYSPGGNLTARIFPYQRKVDPYEHTNKLLGPRWLRELEGVNSIYPWINHVYPSVELTPLNESEIQHGLEILNNDLDWILSKYGGPEPDTPALCFIPDKSFSKRKLEKVSRREMSPQRALLFLGDGIGLEERECYYKLYLALIFGSDFAEIEDVNSIQALLRYTDPDINVEKITSTNSFPLLAYMDSDTSSEQTILEALERRRDLTIETKAKLEERYYYEDYYGTLQIKPTLNLSYVSHLFTYEDMVDAVALAVTQQNDDIDAEFVEFIVERGQTIRKNKLLLHMFATIGLVIGASILCGRFFVGLIASALCQMPFGLGFNAYMLIYDEIRLRKSVHDMLLSPNGLKLLKHIDSLDDYALARNISLATMPIGTGIGPLVRGTPAFSRLLKNAHSILKESPLPK